MRLTQRLEEVRGDVRLAVRQLISAPVFTLVAALTLALGIGVNSAILSLADATLMRPLPFGEAERLVMLWERTPTSPKTGVSPLNMRDWSLQSRSFEGIAFVQRGMGGGPLLTAPDGSIETAERQSISASFFDVLRVVPIVGRTFKPEDDGPSPRVVLLGEAVWRRRFGGDPSIVGRLVRLNGQPYTVVGVVPGNVQFSRPAEIWTLSGQFADIPALRAIRAFDVVARLKPDVTMEAAQAELSVIAARLARAYPEPNKDAGVIVEPIRAGIVGSDLATTSVFLLGVVGFVLLLCCANVANLLLARATARAREIAVRSALGAERGRIIRQLLTESLVLAVFGGMLGIGVGAAILRAAPALIPPGLLPAAVTPAFDVRVVMVGLAAALAVGVVFGVIPAWQATGASLAGVMASESRSATSTGRRLRSLLVSGEVAAAVVLLCGAGLLLQTLLRLVGGDTGYRATSESVLTLDFSVRTGKNSRYPTEEAITQFYDAVGRDVSALPEVRRVGWASSLPYGTRELGRWAFEIIGDPQIEARDRPTAEYTTADPGLQNARSADRERARFQRTRHAAQRARVSRQRGARAPALQGPQPDRRAPLADGAALRTDPRDCRRGATNQRPARRARGAAPGLRAAGAVPDRRRLHGGAAIGRRGGGADAARAAGCRADRSRRAGATRPDARNAVDRVDRRLSLQGEGGRDVRGAGARAGDGRRLWRARLHGSATGTRDWRAHGARRKQRRRDVARVSRGRLDGRNRRHRRRGAGGLVRTPDCDVPLWRRSARPADLRWRARRDPAHRDRRRRRARLACQPHQPRRRVSP
jgi:predicted permease